MRVTYGLPLIIVVCLSTLGWAQERREKRVAPAQPGIRREASETARHTPSSDQQIAAFLHNCCRNEIEIAKFVQEQLTSEQAKEFAAMMVREHTPGCQKLQQVAGHLASAHAPGTPAGAVLREETREETRRETTPEKGAPAAPRGERRPKEASGETKTRVVEEETTVAEARPVGGQPQGFDWVNIHRQLADQCLASTKAEFQKKEGAEFDKCFMTQQIMAHIKTLDELKVLRNYASAELRKDLDETSQMATRHLEEAKKIMEQLKEESGSERVSRKPKTP